MVSPNKDSAEGASEHALMVQSEDWCTEFVVHRYFDIKDVILDAGYFQEVEWQYSRAPATVTRRQVATEHAWVTLSAGLSYRAVTSIFRRLASVLESWRDLDALACHADGVRSSMLRAFRHRTKVDAMVSVIIHLAGLGEDELRCRLAADGLGYIRSLPFMGPATSLHLAKNLGLPVAKPDRHLMRIAEALGASSPQAMCSVLGERTREPPQVVDIVLWRFATLESRYLDFFAATGPRRGQRGLLPSDELD